LIHSGGLDIRNGAPPYQFDQIALCLALLRTDCLHVNVGRDSQTHVAKQLLYDLRIFSVRVQKRSKRVPAMSLGT